MTDWLTVISRYFSGNPDEGSYCIRKGFVASAIFILYTRKSNLIFSDIQNRIFDSEVAALDMMNFEWSYIFPRSRINLPFVVSFIFLGDIGETKLIREASLKNDISGSLRGIPILRLGLESPWSQLNLGTSNALGMHTCPWYQRIMVKRVESALQLLDHDTEYCNMGFECTARVLVLHRNFPWVPTDF